MITILLPWGKWEGSAGLPLERSPKSVPLPNVSTPTGFAMAITRQYARMSVDCGMIAFTREETGLWGVWYCGRTPWVLSKAASFRVSNLPLSLQEKHSACNFVPFRKSDHHQP